MSGHDTTLELFGPDGRRFLSALELDQDRRQVRVLNDELRLELNAERARADSMAAKLRELGIDPASL